MLVDIDRIVVGDRIRKDFGDIHELAEDIKENTLLNALVVTPSGNGDGTYLLIAGERRLRACKSLGYKAVTVNSVGVEDAERALLMEISENECRKEFTKTERLAYARRLARIEAAKAKERQGTRTDLGADLPPSQSAGKTRNIVASQLGTSATQLRQEQYIENNRDLLDPADFANWDEGKLSTNKAFQKVKAAMEEAKAAKAQAEQERDAARRDLAEAYKDSDSLEAENASLRRQVAEKPRPEVVEREVVREVPPADYDSLTRRTKSLEHDNQVYVETNQELRRQNEQMRRELDKAKDLLGMDETMQEIRRDVKYLTSATVGYVRRYGGLTWTAQEFGEIDEASLVELRNAVRNLATFSSTLMDRLDCEYGKRHSSQL